MSPREKEKTLQILFPSASLQMCGLGSFYLVVSWGGGYPFTRKLPP